VGEVPDEEEEARVSKASLLRDRILFYVSLALMTVGGLGFALGSYLHDLLRVPIVGEAYYVFGPINVLYALVGAVLLFVGLALFYISLRGGSLSNEEVEQIKAESEAS
jgi:hypothetical protein